MYISLLSLYGIGESKNGKFHSAKDFNSVGDDDNEMTLKALEVL